MTTEPSSVAVEHLTVGDQLHHAGGLFDVIGVQPSTVVVDQGLALAHVYVTLDEPQGPPVTMTGLDGTVLTHQPYRTVLYRPGVLVRAEIQEELNLDGGSVDG